MAHLNVNRMHQLTEPPGTQLAGIADRTYRRASVGYSDFLAPLKRVARAWRSSPDMSVEDPHWYQLDPSGEALRNMKILRDHHLTIPMRFDPIDDLVAGGWNRTYVRTGSWPRRGLGRSQLIMSYCLMNDHLKSLSHPRNVVNGLPAGQQRLKELDKLQLIRAMDHVLAIGANEKFYRFSEALQLICDTWGWRLSPVHVDVMCHLIPGAQEFAINWAGSRGAQLNQVPPLSSGWEGLTADALQVVLAHTNSPLNAPWSFIRSLPWCCAGPAGCQQIQLEAAIIQLIHTMFPYQAPPAFFEWLYSPVLAEHVSEPDSSSSDEL